MIDEYLRIFCLSIIDDLNEKHKDIPARSDELKNISMDYSEADFVFRIGYFFGERAAFERKKQKKTDQDIQEHVDIFVPSKDFEIEVKFSKPHKSDDGKYNNKLPWEQMVKDFLWLKNEVKKNKRQRAFVVGWFNTDEFNKLTQLGARQEDGKRSGGHPRIDQNKVFYFPFISSDEKGLTESVKIDYGKVGKELSVDIPNFDGQMSCLLLGNKEDIFHIALYF